MEKNFTVDDMTCVFNVQFKSMEIRHTIPMTEYVFDHLAHLQIVPIFTE
jgi:hypothetical protein